MEEQKSIKLEFIGSLEDIAGAVKRAKHIFDNCTKIKEEQREYYEIDGIRLVVEEGKIAGWYNPDPEGKQEQEAIEPKFEIETLEDTIPYMLSKDYSMRLIGEYYQTRIRMEKLQAYWFSKYAKADSAPGSKERAIENLMNDQLTQMRTYLQTLEKRAWMLGVELYAHRKHREEKRSEAERAE